MAEANSDDSSTTLNDLPPNLLRRILFFLPTLDAIQTTVLSRKWRNLWTSLPSLSFDHTLFTPYDSPSITLQFFVHFINRTLILRSRSDLLNLSLRFCSSADLRRYYSHIDSYIRYAVDHNVTDLTLTFHSKYVRRFGSPEDDDAVYDFPLPALQNSSVRVLSIHRCNLTLPVSRSTRFEALRLAFLEQVYLTDAMVSDFVAGCVNLEFLRIHRCHGMKDIRIVSSKLRELCLFKFRCDEGSVEISAPNLRKLTMLFFEVGNYVLEEASSLVNANVCFIHKTENYGYWSKIMRLLGHVERLSVQNWGYKVVAAKDLFCESFSFYNLNYLELQTEYSKSDLLGMAALLEHSPKLETMIVGRTLKLDEQDFEGVASKEFTKINFSLPSLRKLEMKRYWGVEDDLCFLKLVLGNEVVLERIVLFPIRMDGISVPPIVLVKQSQRFHVLHGSFPNLDNLQT